jgi:hypothetical protein
MLVRFRAVSAAMCPPGGAAFAQAGPKPTDSHISVNNSTSLILRMQRRRVLLSLHPNMKGQIVVAPK